MPCPAFFVCNFSKLFSPEFYQLLCAAILGSLIGLERVLAGKDPGMRTFMLVCLGSCAFSILSKNIAIEFNSDPGRIVAQIIPGIGFIGAGSIFRAKDRISGLTTAALLWLTASAGMGIGLGFLSIGFYTPILALTFMYILRKLHQVLKKYKPEAYKNRNDF